MKDLEQTILLALLRSEKLTFNGLQHETDISPRILRTHLNRTLTRNFVHQEGRKGWKRGKSLRYSLADRGKRKIFRSNALDVKEKLVIIKEVARSLDPVVAQVFLEEVKQSLMKLVTYDEGPDFEEEYNRIRKEGKLIASSDDEEGEKAT